MKKKNQPTAEDVAAQTQLPNEETLTETTSETTTETNAETPVGKPEEAQVKEQEKEPAEEAPEADMEAKLAEAENRGYLRGRNERIAELMREPAMFERQNLPAGCQGGFPASADWQGDSKPMILNSPHISIWDR